MRAGRDLVWLLLAALLIGGLVSACGGWFGSHSADECRSDRDCPSGERCDECASSSCQDCDDCIAGCVAVRRNRPRPAD